MATTGHESEAINVQGLKASLQKFKTDKVDGKSDKSATVSTVSYDTTNKKLTKTINGTTSDIVSIAKLKTDMSLSKSDVGLNNVGNFKAVSTEASQGLTATEQTNARTNIAAVGQTINKTWSELKTMRDNSTLIPGQWYRITDYQTTTSQADTQSARHQFDVIVRADATNVLNENAYAAKHASDTYFTNSNLSAWELKYCIDNDTSRFSWANSNGKGVIWWMKDEHDNECPYDFKNIQFKRYKLKNKNHLHLADYPLGEDDYKNVVQKAFDTLKERMGTEMNADNISLYYTRGMYEDGYIVSGAEIYDYSSDYESYDGGGMYLNDESEGNYVSMLYCYDSFDIIAEVEDTNGEWFYTFSKKASASAAATDASFDSNCHHNIIKKADNLNDNVFMVLGSSLSCYGNSFGINCYNNSIGNNVYYNSIGNNFNTNSIGNSFYGNTIGNYFQNNSIGNYFRYNSIGNNFNINSIGNNVYYNSIGNDFGYNTIGNDFGYNTIGNNVYNNTIGNSFYRNSIGNGFNTNSIGNYFQYNSIGNGFNTNSIGNYFQNNSIGNGCQEIQILKDYVRYIIIENGNISIELTSNKTTSSSNWLQNFTISQGCSNNEISHNSVNDTSKTTYQPTNSQVVSV